MPGSITDQDARTLAKVIRRAKAKLLNKYGPYVEKYWTVDRYKTCDDCKLNLVNKTYDELYEEISGSV